MEEEPRERSRSRAPQPRQDGPRGRGLGAPTAEAFKCARCGAEASFESEVDVHADCRSCGDALHSCVNCRHFDTSARNECRAGIEERVVGKSRGNTCTKFEPKIVQGFESDSDDSDPKKAFDELFDF